MASARHVRRPDQWNRYVGRTQRSPGSFHSHRGPRKTIDGDLRHRVIISLYYYRSISLLWRVRHSPTPSARTMRAQKQYLLCFLLFRFKLCSWRVDTGRDERPKSVRLVYRRNDVHTRRVRCPESDLLQKARSTIFHPVEFFCSKSSELYFFFESSNFFLSLKSPAREFYKNL